MRAKTFHSCPTLCKHMDRSLPGSSVHGVLQARLCVCVSSVVSDSLRPMDCSPPGSSVHVIFQAGILEWVAISSFRGSSQVSCISCIGRQILYYGATWEALAACCTHLKTSHTQFCIIYKFSVLLFTTYCFP